MKRTTPTCAIISNEPNIQNDVSMAMKAMVVGGNGLLGQKLIEVMKRETGWEITSVIRAGIADANGGYYFDTTQKRAWKETLLQERWRPDVIINAAGLNDLDRCELNREDAWRSNVQLVETLTDVCRKIDSRMIQLSSDQIFDGTAGPYEESASPRPVNYFGKTKLAAENVLTQSGVTHAVVRTTWLYGEAERVNPTYVDHIARALALKKSVAVPTDEYGTPTLTDDVAYGIIRLIECGWEGVLNIAGPQTLSRYDIAQQVARSMGLETRGLIPTTSNQTADIAKRPLKGGLVSLKAHALLGIAPLRLEQGLKVTMIQKERKGWPRHM